MTLRFYGRKDELAKLREKNWRGKALLATIYGRRRVGKTALVEEAFKYDSIWKFEGVEGANKKNQIKLFLMQLRHYSGTQEKLGATDWHEALLLLENYICEYEKKTKKKLVIFLDEFQWLCEMKATLVAEFKFFWDNYFSKHSEAVFVICGSISSFIVKKVIQSRALYGRIDLEMELAPLSIKESFDFFNNTPFENQVLEMYMVFGGIPQYWLQLNPELSLIQNLNEFAFKSSGYFFKEFDRLFISHFAASDIYEKVLKQLSIQSLTLKELVEKCNLSSGGVFSEKVKDLELAGFIRKEIPVDKKVNSRLFRYSLSDEYLHFYFRFILPFIDQLIAGNVSYQQISSRSEFAQWQGYAFERLCKKHAAVIADFLKFSGIDYKVGSWFLRSNKDVPGCQVDLIFVRSDRVLSVCEVKYSSSLNMKKVITDFQKKCDILKQYFNGYGIQKILITRNDIPAKTAYFDHVISATELFL